MARARFAASFATRPLVFPVVVALTLAGARTAQSLVNWESPHVHPLAATPDKGRLLAVNTPDNRLEVFSLASGSPVKIVSIPVGLDPVSVRARTNQEAWVVNHISDTVSVVDLFSRNVIATLPTDDEPTDVVFAPVLSAASGRSASEAPQRAFVSCSQANTVLVFDVHDLAAPPKRIELFGEEPKALAVNPLRGEVYVAFFESGNQTTILAGRQPIPRPYPPKAVLDPTGPYGGASPPPNSGASFEPPVNPALTTPPEAGLIVRRSAAGQWQDDNGGDWTPMVSGSQAARSGRPVGWHLADHDVGIIDVESLEVRYQSGLMNLCMALDVNPASGEVTVVGTDAMNHIRFLSNLTGVFLRVELARFTPGDETNVVLDLNPQLDYSSATVSQSVRDLGLADPRAIAWTNDGSRAYVSGMGSNNVVALGPDGQRLAIPPIEVGQGPTGLVLDEGRSRLYVLDKFQAALTVVNTNTNLAILSVPFFDPSPAAIQDGRKHLYNAHATSGTGIVSCASCHVDGRMDRLAWDLGEPDGNMKPVDEQELFPPGLVNDWHPMKGPLVTMTLQDIIGKEPFHWRGDRDGIEEFNDLYEKLLGDDAQISPAQMQQYEDFLATLYFPPNPFRNFDNSLKTSLPLPGHYSTGVYSAAGTPLPNGNAVNGRDLTRPPNTRAGGQACATCHTSSTTVGTDTEFVGGMFVPRPPGPNGERYSSLSVFSLTAIKNAQYRNLYERVGLEATQVENLAGFGFSPEGSVDSLARFVSPPNFQFNTLQEVSDIIAFLLSTSGELGAGGSSTTLLEPPGVAGRHTHAAVGAQITFDTPTPAPALVAQLDAMIVLADAGAVGLVAKGKHAGLARGYTYLGSNQFQSDRLAEMPSRATLTAQGGPGSELTFTVVPLGSQQRIGIDRDSDGLLDRDEIDGGGNPEGLSTTRVRLVPPGKRP